MKFESITIKQLAKDLNLGISTVSRALHDSHEISAKTKEKVQAYAQKMNYIPNPIALSLRDKRNKSIGIVISQLNNPFCSQVANGIESVAYANGYQVSIVQTNECAAREKEAIQYLSSRVDGLLISISSATKTTGHLHALHDKGMPIVFFDRICPDIATHMTISDNYQAAFEATNHLIEQDYHRIGFIGGASTLSIVGERRRGYLDAMKKAGIPVEDKWVRYCAKGGVEYEETAQIIDKWMRLPKGVRPEALLTGWDRVTIDAYRYLRQNDFHMPGDMALIGFCNFPLTDLVYPSLSVIRQQTELLGSVSARQLIGLLENKRSPDRFQTEVLMPELIIRETSQRV